METLQTSSFAFAGIDLVGGVSSDGLQWVKAVDVQKAVGKPDNSYRNFLSGKSPEALLCRELASGKSLEDGRRLFKVPGYNKPVAFILAESTALYWTYQASKANQAAKDLVTATVAADLIRTIKETNGIQVTAAQHEETRTKIRLELIDKYLAMKVTLNQMPLSNWDEQEVYVAAKEEERQIAASMTYDEHEAVNAIKNGIQAFKTELYNSLPQVDPKGWRRANSSDDETVQGKAIFNLQQKHWNMHKERVEAEVRQQVLGI